MAPGDYPLDPAFMPLDDAQWRSILDWAAAGGTAQETDWLEFKESDPTTKSGAAKAAKFIIGTANRPPAAARDHLQGHALLFMGVAKDGTIPGVSAKEALAAEKLIHPFLDPELRPRMRLKKIPIGDGREVVVIISLPRPDGDPPWCAQQTGDGIDNGYVYIRVASETRHVRADEMNVLLRGYQTADRITLPDIAVALATPVFALAANQVTIDEHVEKTRSKLLHDLPSEVEARRRAEEERWKPSALDGVGLWAARNALDASRLARQRYELSAAFRSVTDAMNIPEDRTEDQYREQVSTYCEALRSWFNECLDGGYAAFVATARFRIALTNQSIESVQNLQVTIHIEGPIQNADDDSYPERPERIRPWGPRNRMAIGLNSQFPTDVVGRLAASGTYDRLPARGPTATSKNTGSVEVTLDDINLRSEESVTIKGNTGLIVTDPQVKELRATWEARATNTQGVARGEFVIRVGDSVDPVPILLDEYGD